MTITGRFDLLERVLVRHLGRGSIAVHSKTTESDIADAKIAAGWRKNSFKLRNREMTQPSRHLVEKQRHCDGFQNNGAGKGWS